MRDYHRKENGNNQSSNRRDQSQHAGSRMALRPSRRKAYRTSGPPRLLLVGANHRTCPLDSRERLVRHVTYARLKRLAGRNPPWEDVVLLSTCNRVEIYTVSRTLRPAEATLKASFAPIAGPESLYRLEDVQAAAHLFRVATGLDSVAQGERQVADQVRRAPSGRPEDLRAKGPLAVLFERAGRYATRIRGLAAVYDPAASASHAAVRYLRDVVPLPHPAVVLIGSGKMARLAASALRGRARITVVDRRLEKAETLAAYLGGTARRLDDLRWALLDADVVIAATGASKPIVSLRALTDIVEARAGRTLWLIDLGVPRNFGPRARELPGVTHMDIDALGPWASRPPSPAALARAEERIREESRAFVETLHSEGDDAVATLRRAVEAVRTQEVDEAIARLPAASAADRAVIEKLTRRLVNRLLHAPTRRLRELDAKDRAVLVRSFLNSWRGLGGGRG